MFARKMLVSSTLGLLGVAGLLAAAGPRWDWGNLTIDFGRGGNREVLRRPQPRVYEVAPERLELTAFQSEDEIIVFAQGANSDEGFRTSLERSYHDGRQVVILRNIAPERDCDDRGYNFRGGYDKRGGYHREARCTPFSVSGSLETRGYGCLNEIKVLVAGQERCVPVTHIARMDRAW